VAGSDDEDEQHVAVDLVDDPVATGEDPPLESPATNFVATLGRGFCR